MYVTPSAAKEFREARENKDLQDKIIKQFVTSETDWLKDDIKDMDKITLRYRAKLLTLQDSFSEAQDIYTKEIESLYTKSYEAFQPIASMFATAKESIKSLKQETESFSLMVSNLSKSVGYIDYSRIEKLLDLIDRYNKMSVEEKTLIQLILNNPKP